jgi:hypothetical protein
MGDVFGVYSSWDKAEKEMKEFMEEDSTTDPDDWSIQMWEVDGDHINTVDGMEVQQCRVKDKPKWRGPVTRNSSEDERF